MLKRPLLAAAVASAALAGVFSASMPQAEAAPPKITVRTLRLTPSRL
jgi:hypothetical protein